ncbi:MAG: hypothetical protein IKH42_00880 [Lachnospiraceae bacterium]|nr:hypothetical protein [Lachnospiraceae bacterium]MBR3579428.1 hypothetical protein [Lachnospiraceae bacterium]MBR4541354.1 hypothetical protein [Lachnospiraceae bacterium]
MITYWFKTDDLNARDELADKLYGMISPLPAYQRKEIVIMVINDKENKYHVVISVEDSVEPEFEFTDELQIPKGVKFSVKWEEDIVRQ